MTCCEKKEVNVLDTIASKITKLDEHLTKMNDTESKLKGWVEQELAIHDVRSIVRHSLKLDKIEDKAQEKGVEIYAKLTEDEKKIVAEINDKFTNLDATLEKLEASNDKIKTILEHEKAIFEIKEILKKANKLESLETK